MSTTIYFDQEQELNDLLKKDVSEYAYTTMHILSIMVKKLDKIAKRGLLKE